MDQEINTTWDNLVHSPLIKSCKNCVLYECHSDNLMCSTCLKYDSYLDVHFLVNWKWNGKRD